MKLSNDDRAAIALAAWGYTVTPPVIDDQLTAVYLAGLHAGMERMREAAAKACEDESIDADDLGLEYCADAIRALPVE